MKATLGHLPVNQKYTLINTFYADDEMDRGACENCDKIIANIATVKGIETGQTYNIGLDCAETLTHLIPSELAEIKKNLRLRAKFIKFLKTEAKSAIVDKHGVYYYSYITTTWKVNRKWQGAREAGLQLIKKYNIPYTEVIT